MKVYLIDGTYELFRRFYGPPGRRGPDGREVGATRAFLRDLLALVTTPGVTHLACAFDEVIESFRNDLFAGYKTGDGIDPDLWDQAPLAAAAAEAMGVVTWRMVEFEADDALASAAARFRCHPGVEQVLICSPDKDLAQCVVGAEVVLFDRRRDKVYDQTAVRDKWGVEPESMPDWLALVGDAADGIPGVPRWGAKSAARVLATYGCLDDIPDDENRWTVTVRGAASLAASLRDHREPLDLYKMLATLRTDVPLAEEVADLEWRGADREALDTLCAEIGDERFVERVPRFR